MVLGVRVGKRRGFWRGFLLSLGTVGFYAVYWNYKAHDEVYKQFELQRENRDEGVVWYILGLIFPPLVFAYLWIFASNVAYVRDRMQLRRRTTPARFVGLLGVGLGSFLVTSLLLLVAMAAAPIVEGVDAETVEEVSTPLVDTMMTLFLGSLVVLVVASAVAYYRLQRDINELWDAYDARVRQLREAPPRGPLEVLPPLPPHPTTWAPELGLQAPPVRPHGPEP